MGYLLYTLITAASVVTATVAEKSRRERESAHIALLLLFLILWIPSMLRQATGNDYMRYVEFFHLANVDAYVPTEVGFNLAVKLIYGLCGYENYLLVFAIFAGITIACFVGAIWREKGAFHWSFALFMLMGFYFQSYNTVRYYLALSLVLWGAMYLLEGKYAAFVIWTLLAASFHKSALIVLILYPLALHVWKRWELAVAAALGIILYAGQSIWMKVIIRLYPSYEGTEILEAGGSISISNVLRCAAVLIFVIWAIYQNMNSNIMDRRLRFYTNATVMALFLYIFGSFIPELSRICYYLVVMQIFLLPRVLKALPRETAAQTKKYRLAAAVIALAGCLVFAGFLHKATDAKIRILPYRTFLFHELPQTPSRSIKR